MFEVMKLSSRQAVACDIRASFLRFPSWTQHFWTWLTGKALPHQRPLVSHTWWSYLAATLASFFSGLALSSFALSTRFAWWHLALAAGILLSLSAARVMILVIAHQCIHGRFSGSTAVDRVVGELVTLLNVYQDAAAFKAEHFEAHHRPGVFATIDDPPVQSLVNHGFRPGMPRALLWRRAFLVFLSPAFYWNGFVDRLKCNLVSGSWRRALFYSWFGFWLSVPFWMENGTVVLLIAFVLPVILLAQLSALLDRLGEHAWLTLPDPQHGPRFYTVSASWARFCGAAVPQPGTDALDGCVRWFRWLLLMVAYHIPSRLLVIVGDLPNHDFHHRFPATPDWTIAAYARQADIDRSAATSPPYSEIWGMAQAIDQMFSVLSAIDLEAVPHERLDR